MLFLVILLFTLISCVHAAEQQIDAPEKIWRKNFEQLREFKTTQSFEVVIRWQKLQHDPQITLVVKDDPTIIQQSGPTLFIHGWGGNKDSYTTSRLCSSNNIPGDVITFNFPDASYWIKETIPYWMPISQSSFAGHKDIVTLLAVVKTLHSANCLPAVWYAHSRGSGITKAAIGILNNPSKDEKDLLIEWGINDKVRKDIINAIKIIYLLNPLTNFDIALNKQIQSKLMVIDYFLPFLRKKIIAPTLKKHILPFLTHYDPQQKNPIDYIQQWNDLQCKVWLHFEENDQSVSNEDDVNLITQLSEKLSDNLYVSCTNNDGGHDAYPVLINQIIHHFNQKNNCSHRNTSAEISNKTSLISDAKFVPSNATPLQHLNSYSQKHTQNNFSNHRMTRRLVSIIKISLFSLLLYYLNQSSYGIFGLKFAMNDQFFTLWKV